MGGAHHKRIACNQTHECSGCTFGCQQKLKDNLAAKNLRSRLSNKGQITYH